jgi:cellulose synthase operon protein C
MLKISTKKILTHAVIALAVSAMMGCSSPQEKVAKYMRNGQEHMANKEWVKARVEFQNALQIEPNRIDALKALADVAERLNEWQNLFGILSKIVEIDPKDVAAQIRLAKLLVAAGELDKAMVAVRAAEAVTPDDTDVYAVRAALLFKIEDYAGAVELANKSLAKNPKNQDALIVLASERMMANDPQAALQYMDRGLQSDDKNVAFQLIKVQALEKLSKLDNAEEVFRKLITYYPDNQAFKRTLAYFYQSHGQLDKAEAELRALTKAAPTDTKTQLELVRFMFATKGFGAAKSELEALSKAHEDNFEYLFALADLNFAASKTDDGIAVYKSIIEKAGDKAEGTRAMALLARLELSKGNKQKASDMVTEVLKRDARNEEGLLLKAGLLLDAGKLEDAIGDLRTILRDTPDSSRAHLLLARTHELQGAKDLAMDHYGRAWTSSKRTGQFGIPYAEHLTRAGKANQAPQVLKDVLKNEPGNTQAVRLLAKAYIANGDLVAAQALADGLAKSQGGATESNYVAAAVHEARQNYSDSIAAFRRAYDSAPTDIQPLVALVNGYVKAGKTKEAIEFIQSVLASSPNNTSAQLLLARLQQNAGQTDAARAGYEAVIQKEPGNVAAHQGLVSLHATRNQLDEALKAADRGLQVAPKDLGLRISKAGIFETQAKANDAISIYEDLLKQNPNMDVVINNLASLLLDQRTDKPSLDRAVQLSERFRNSDVPQFLDTYGWALHKVGRHDDAASAIKKAVERMPDQAILHYHLGMVQLAQKNKTAAKASLTKAVELSKTTPFPQLADAQKTLQGI